MVEAFKLQKNSMKKIFFKMLVEVAKLLRKLLEGFQP